MGLVKMPKKTDEFTAVIDEILPRQNAQGKSYHILRVDGEGYFVWDAKIIEGLKAGDTVALTVIPGEYPKVTAIGTASAAAPSKKSASQPVAAPTAAEETESVSRQQGIHRSVSLQEANKFVQHFAVAGMSTGTGTADAVDMHVAAKHVVDVAAVFAKFLGVEEKDDGSEKP